MINNGGVGLHEDFLEWLEKSIESRFKNKSALAEYCGVEPNKITRWLHRQRIPKLNTAGDVLEKLGAKIVIVPDRLSLSESHAISVSEIRSVADVERLYRSAGATNQETVRAMTLYLESEAAKAKSLGEDAPPMGGGKVAKLG